MDIDLVGLIEKEGRRNDGLRKIMQEEGEPPSEEVLKELGAENLLEILKNSTAFKLGMSMEIMLSNNYLIRMIGLLVQENEKERVAGVYPPQYKEISDEYKENNEKIKKYIISRFMAGYDAMW